MFETVPPLEGTPTAIPKAAALGRVPPARRHQGHSGAHEGMNGGDRLDFPHRLQFQEYHNVVVIHRTPPGPSALSIGPLCENDMEQS